MRLGLFMMPVHPPGRLLAETLAEDEEKALYADRLGFDELWLGEHFSATTEPIPSPLMFMASLIPRTKNLTFGTAVICLPNHHPVKVAAEVPQFADRARRRAARLGYHFGQQCAARGAQFALADLQGGLRRCRQAGARREL